MRLKLEDLVVFLVRWRKFYIINVLVIAVISSILSLIAPARYTSTAKVLPMAGEMVALSSQMTAGISRLLGGLPSLPGMVNPADICVAILKSRDVGERIVDSLDLMKVYRTKFMEDALRKLYKNVEFTVQPNGILEISCRAKDRMLAYRMTKLFVDELDRFNRASIMTKGKYMRIFIEKRLQEVEQELKNAEDKLKEFNTQNKTIKLDEEILQAIKTYSELKAQLLAKEIQRDYLKSIGEKDNPDLRRIEEEVQAIKSKLREIEFGNAEGFGAGFSISLAQLPEKSIEYMRLLREVEVKNKLYGFLVEQYESAKILEEKDTPTLQILEEPNIPEKRSWPQRKVIVLTSVLFSLFFSIFLSAIFEYSEKVFIRNEKLQRSISILRDDLQLGRKK